MNIERVAFLSSVALVILVVNVSVTSADHTITEGFDGQGQNEVTLTYHFENYTDDTPVCRQRDLIIKALANWSKHVKIHWKETCKPDQPDGIDIRFEPEGWFEDIGQPDAQAVARANGVPGINVDIVYNDKFHWGVLRQNFLDATGRHEVGHVLGLGHTSLDVESVMSPGDYFIKPHDVEAIQSLYSSGQGSVSVNGCNTNCGIEGDFVAGLGEGSGGWMNVMRGNLSGFMQADWAKAGWPEYNRNNGETHVSPGKLDDDPETDYAVGFAAPDGNGWVEIIDGAWGNFQHLEWIRVNWQEFNRSDRNTTRPLCVDLFGDNQDEIVVGLGKAGKGWLEVFERKNGSYTHKTWVRVNWSDYNQSGNAPTYPAGGDLLNFDGEAELVIGLGSEGNGWFEIKKDIEQDFQTHKWQRVSWKEYNKQVGETRPAVGNFGVNAEIVVGLGSYPSNGGWMQYFGGDGFAPQGWLRVPWKAYNRSDGQTTPTVTNVDAVEPDLTPNWDEIVVGLGSDSNGWMPIFNDGEANFELMGWSQVNWKTYNQDNGATYPSGGSK